MTRGRYKSEGLDAAAVGERLRLTRHALDKKQGDFARSDGIERNTYNQYETGVNKISTDMAHKLCDAYAEYGLTFDWIYRGDPSGLRTSLAEAIRALRQARQSDN